jgi:hypothetical protein
MQWRHEVLSLVSLACIFSGLAYAALDGTPEQALIEVVTASKAEVVEKHLPVATTDAIRHLSAADRRAAEEEILIGKKLREAGLEARIPDDADTLLQFWRTTSEEEQGPEVTITREREIVGGCDAMLELAVEGQYRKLRLWMKFEEGEWRFTQLEWGYTAESTDLDSSFVDRLKRTRQQQPQAPALALLRSINAALDTYSADYPEIGFPGTLAVLSPAMDGQDPSPDHAGLLWLDLSSDPYVSDGYVLTYRLLAAGPEGAYSLTARPQSRKPGDSSFYTDESGVIRYTFEDRDATADDDSIE